MPITDKNIVTAPVHVEEMASFFGCRAELGTVCTSGAINKWAIYKPQSPAAHTDVSLMTLEERKADYMGLIPTEISCFKSSIHQTDTTVESAISEWGYKARTTPYRIHDFLCDNTVNSNGYNHNAKPCDSDWEDMEYNRNYLETAKVDSFYLSHGYSLRLTEQTATNINGADSDFMPLSYACGLTGNMYFGIAIHLVTSARDSWFFIRGNKSLKEAADMLSPQPTDIMPCFKSNEWLASTILNETDNNSDVSFKYVPCIIINPSDETTVVGTTTKTTMTVGNATIYCMPSGTKSHTLTFFVTIGNESWTLSDGNIAYKIRGKYYIKMNDSYNAEILYIVKPHKDSSGKLISGWFLVRVPRQTAQGSFILYGLAIVYANVVTDSNVWQLATSSSQIKESLSNYGLTMRCKYYELAYDSTGVYVSVSETKYVNVTLTGITPDTSESTKYQSDYYDPNGVYMYGVEVATDKYAPGLTVEYVINPTTT